MKERTRPRMVSVKTAAQLLNVSPRTVYRRIEDGELLGWRFGHGGPIRVSTTALVNSLEPHAPRGDGEDDG